ncbi:MAG: queuosine precursor transporter [Bacteroidetes bacterium]|nr:queuosine precursor transporter [Bacteroidota bacterium]
MSADSQSIKAVSSEKKNLLFLLLAGFFLTNALLAEFIGVKIFSAERTLGLPDAGFRILGYTLNFQLTAGVILWPVVFVITDIVNEYFGKKGVQRLTMMAIALIVYAFIMVRLAIWLTPADWWAQSASTKGLRDLNQAYSQVFGQGLFIIIGSLCAFLIGQVVDAGIFRALRMRTGAKAIWLRATGSTLVSQLLDSYVVLLIAFYWGADWPLSQVLAVGTMGYIYKFSVAILLTPVLYFVHHRIDRFLGKELSDTMMEEALN